jgi:N4-gp56 family major capsid protein
MSTLNTSGGTIGAAAPSAGDYPANHKFYQAKFLEALQPALLYDKWGETMSVPANNSNTVVKNKLSELSDLNGSALTEGTTPSEQTLSLTRIEKSIDQYGGYMRVSDRLTEESINGLTAEFSKRLGEQAARTMNKVRRDGLLGGTNVRYQAGGVDADAITTQLSGANVATDLDFILDAFRDAKVKPFTPLANGSTNIGTTPIPSAYPVIVPVEAVDLVRAATGFNEVEEYADAAAPLHANEFGRYRSFRFIYDTEVSQITNATSDVIAQCLIFGCGDSDKAYATVDLAGGNMQMITKPLGSSGTSDPLNQRASMGWKAKQATFIIQDTFMFRWEVKIDAT